MRRHSKRSTRQDKNRLLGWVYGGIGVVIICGIITAAVLLNLHRKETDPVTGCPKDGYESITSVLVDLTDPINPVQEAALQNALLKVRDEVPKYGRLEIYPLKPTITTAIEPLFFGCSPGSGRDEDNGFYGNPELANRRWKRMFADKVDAVINELQKLPPQQNSPLLEGLQSVAVTSLGSPLAANASTKRILLLSDMIHHTPELSMYKGAPDFVQFKSTQYYPRIKPTLRGAQVDVFLIVRDTQKHVQQPPLYKFWVEFMNASGGFLQNWEPLQ